MYTEKLSIIFRLISPSSSVLLSVSVFITVNVSSYIATDVDADGVGDSFIQTLKLLSLALSFPNAIITCKYLPSPLK